jgi:hypothetical protein
VQPRRNWVALALAVAAVLLGAAWALNVFEVRARSPLATVASAFDAPPAYPGYRWSRGGREVSQFEIVSIAGPSHCGWQSATMLNLAWPIGSSARSGDQLRQYVRDPAGEFGPTLRGRLALNAALPKDAAATGFRLGDIELYLAPSDQDDAIYVVARSGTERWPRANPMQLCS